MGSPEVSKKKVISPKIKNIHGLEERKKKTITNGKKGPKGSQSLMLSH